MFPKLAAINRISGLGLIYFSLAATPVAAQIFITASGGGSSQPTFTISQPVNFSAVATEDVNQSSPYAAAGFVIQATFSSAVPALNTSVFSSTLVLTDNTLHESETLDSNWYEGYNAGAPSGQGETANDSMIYFTTAGFGMGINAGDSLTLSAGTYTGNAKSSFQGFTSGNYDVYLVNSDSYRISTNGISATPEPSTWAMLLGGLNLLIFWRLRSNKKPFPSA